jgi:hypothetical protein
MMKRGTVIRGKTYLSSWTATLNDRLEQHHQSDEDGKQQQAMNDAGSIEEPVDDDISFVSELSETRGTFLMNRLSEGKHPHIAMRVRVCTRETTHPARSLSLPPPSSAFFVASRALSSRMAAPAGDPKQRAARHRGDARERWEAVLLWRHRALHRVARRAAQVERRVVRHEPCDEELRQQERAHVDAVSRWKHGSPTRCDTGKRASLVKCVRLPPRAHRLV